MRWRTDDQGLATLPSFIVATAVFTVVFASATYFASDYIAEEKTRDNSLDGVAAAALATLQSSPGTPETWHTGGALVRWGLVKTGSEATLDGEKVQAVRDWGGDRGKYDDARKALGLDDYQMRLRLYPKFEADGIGLAALANRKVGYVGAWDEAAQPAPAFASWVAEEREGLDLAGVDFANAEIDTLLVDGLTAGDVVRDTGAQLDTHFVPRLYGFPAAEDLDQLGTYEAKWSVVRTSNACWGTMDPAYERILTMSTCVNVAGLDLWKYGSTVDLGGTPTMDRVVLAEVDLTTVDDPGDTAKLLLTHKVSGADPLGSYDPVLSDYGILGWYCVEGCGVPAWQADFAVATTTAGFETDEFTLNALLGKRVLLALSWHAFYDQPVEIAGDGWFIAKAEVVVTDDGVTSTRWVNDLSNPTSYYDALVVGSDVDQDALATTEFSPAVLDWIDEGGHLVLTGNVNPDLDWLGPYGAGGTPPTVNSDFLEDKTDHLHSILNNPHNLRYTTYSTPSKAYKPSPSYLSGVVKRVQDDPNDPLVALLHVSNGGSPWGLPGTPEALDDGVLVFAAFRPVDMGAPEAGNFYANAFVYQFYNWIVLDYGGTVLKSQTLGSAARTVLIDASAMELGTLEAQMVLHVWQ